MNLFFFNNKWLALVLSGVCVEETATGKEERICNATATHPSR